MIHFNENQPRKKLSSLLILVMIAGSLTIQSQPDEHPSIERAAVLFNQGEFSQALLLLEKIESSLEEENDRLLAKVFILYGACYEKTEKSNLAKLYYKKVEDLLFDGRIKHLPETGITDLQSLVLYQRCFTESGNKAAEIEEKDEEQDRYHFHFKKPKPVTPVDTQDIIYSKAKLKKKRKFPWIPVIVAGIVVASVITYVLFFRKDSEKSEAEIPEIEWVYIPPGEFLMGDNFNEGDSDELPVHSVYLDGYYISTYVISTYQFNQYCRDNQLPLNSNSYYHSDLTPAIYLNWTEAEAFCQWLSNKTDDSIFLPTEAQWERAARGTRQFRYPWGDDPPDCEKANYGQCTYGPNWVNDFSAGRTPTGIYNMAGNVWEWCRDFYNPTYYSQSPYQNPQGPNTGQNKVIRGGYFRSPEIEIRSANRYFTSINDTGYIGFRVVKEGN